MRIAGRSIWSGLRVALSGVIVFAGLATILAPLPSAAQPVSKSEFESAAVHTDGHFRPGRIETIRVSGFPRAGKTEVLFFPSAICEAKCGAVARLGGSTNAAGSGVLKVRVPGYFFNAKNKRTFFRDRERIDLQVTWNGTNEDEFAVGTPRRRPVIVRSDRGKR